MKSTNLREALDAGLAAFERGEASRREILAVFSALVETIQEATANRVSLAVQDVQDLARPVDVGGLVGAAEYLRRALRGENQLVTWKVWLLRAQEGGEQVRSEELFRAQIAQYGYPVSLKFLDERVVCYDRESLEGALDDLLRRPEIGEKVAKLKTTPPEPA